MQQTIDQIMSDNSIRGGPGMSRRRGKYVHRRAALSGSRRRDEQPAIEQVNRDKRDADTKEYPEQIPRHALQHFPAVNVAADSKQFQMPDLGQID